MKECILCFAYAAALGVLSFFLGRLLPHLHVGGQALESAANPQMAIQGAGYEPALQKAHAGEKTHAADSAGASSDDSGNLRG